MQRTRTRLSAALILAAALSATLTAGCASGAAEGGRSSSGGGSSASASSSRGPGTASTFPQETRGFMEEGLRQFSRQDPQWQTTRATWLAMGPRESEFLVQTMWAALLRSQSLDAPDLVERARHELALIGAPSIPLVSAVLREGTIGTVTDAASGATGEMKVDDLQRREASQILTLIGAPAVPALTDVLQRSGPKSGKRYALQALGTMGSRGGDAAARTVSRYAGDGDLTLAVEAVTGLRNFTDDGTRNALIGALSGGDPLVREKAAESLGFRGELSALGPVRAAAAAARAEGRIAEAARLDRAASTIEKKAK